MDRGKSQQIQQQLDQQQGEAPTPLAELVAEFARAASSESGGGEANRLLGQIRAGLYSRLNNTSAAEEKVQLIEMAGQMVDLLNTENASVMVPVLANVLRTALSDTGSFSVIKAAAALLGRLASKRGFLIISETISFELKRALEWLPDNYENRRLASVLVLSELAVAAPASLYQQMDRYLSSMWTALCDVQRPIFTAAAKTLYCMLEVVLRRGTEAQAVRVFSRVLDEALAGLQKNQTVHGALLAIGELFGLEASGWSGRVGHRSSGASLFKVSFDLRVCVEAALFQGQARWQDCA